jgi:hypothetical protein
MHYPDLSIVSLVAILLALVALFVIVRGFRVPKEFHENEMKRAAMRKRLLEHERARKNEKMNSGNDADEPEPGA